jgi:hypothetical protein
MFLQVHTLKEYWESTEWGPVVLIKVVNKFIICALKTEKEKLQKEVKILNWIKLQTTDTEFK